MFFPEARAGAAATRKPTAAVSHRFGGWGHGCLAVLRVAASKNPGHVPAETKCGETPGDENWGSMEGHERREELFSIGNIPKKHE